MKRIIILGAGGTPATNFVRSLRLAGEEFYLIGTDCNKYYLSRAETDIGFLVPPVDHHSYVKVLNSIIEETGADFIHAQNDDEVFYLSKYRDRLKVKTFLPRHRTIEICQDKFKSHRFWQKAEIPQPKTILIRNEKDLKKALDDFKGHIWLRDTSGAGGKGSLAAKNFKIAKSWLDFREGWGNYTAAECLSPQSITWQSIWFEGRLIVAQARKRIYWELAKIAPSGITGVTGTGMTVSDKRLDKMARLAILAIDKRPHGIFSLDLTYDQNNIPNPTEINIARFFTTHEFFSRVGLNMPLIFVKLAYGESLPPIKKKTSSLPNNLLWIRGMDFLPVLTTKQAVDNSEEELERRLKKIDNVK